MKKVIEKFNHMGAIYYFFNSVNISSVKRTVLLLENSWRNLMPLNYEYEFTSFQNSVDKSETIFC